MKKKKGYHASDLVSIFLALFTLQLIISFISNQILADDLVWLQTSLLTCLTFGLIIYWQLTSKQLSVTTYFTNPSLSNLKLSGLLLASLGLSIVLSEVNNITHCFLPLSQAAVEQINQIMSTKSNFFFSGFVLLTAAAALREIFFRGLILQGLLANYSWEKAAGFTILLQLILEFSLFHLLGVFTLSLLLNWLYLQSKSLVLCVLGNIFYSAIPYLFLYYLPYKIPGYNTKLSTTAQFQPLWFNILGLLLLGLGAYLLTNNLTIQREIR